LGGPEFILQNFDSGQAFLKADDPTSGNQLQGALIVELGGPTDCDFEASPGQQDMLGGEENAVAGDVYGLAVPRFLACALVQELVTDIPFDREAIGVAPIGLFLVLSTGSHFFRFLSALLSALAKLVSPGRAIATIGYEAYLQ
jgi:hypothetical protein